MKRLLVTGGAGFIGSNFVRYILGKYPDYRVTALDALTYAGNLDNFHDLWANPNFQFIQGRIEDASIVDNLARNVDAYKSHLAACDQPRRNDLDGRGNLSEENLAEFTRFFLKTCIDQVTRGGLFLPAHAAKGRA